MKLYRVFEVIREDARSEDQMIENGWTTRRQISRFRHTMNSVATLGAEARHGVEQTTPPTDPMPMSQAREFIRHLLVPVDRLQVSPRVAFALRGVDRLRAVAISLPFGGLIRGD